MIVAGGHDSRAVSDKKRFSPARDASFHLSSRAKSRDLAFRSPGRESAFARVARALSPVRVLERARLQSCRTSKKKDPGTANPPDQTKSIPPAQFPFSNRAAALSILSHGMESFSTLTPPQAKLRRGYPAPPSSVSFSPFRSIRPILPTWASLAETTYYGQV